MVGRKITPAAGMSLAFARPAFALKHHKLEIDPYRTAQKGEPEIEYGSVYTDRGTGHADSPWQTPASTALPFARRT
jgi:hypothetical protein